MATVEMLEAQVQQLDAAQLSIFREWFYKFDAQADEWDVQIERDVKAGKLDALANLALDDYRAGRAIDL